MDEQRPSWLDIYMTMAFVVAERSHDLETKVGCVITSPENIVLGTGYNGFPSGIYDKDLPRNRPGKYEWILHSEENCVLNCNQKPINGIAYITTAPCFPCLKRLWQAGIRTIYYSTLYTAKSALASDHILRENFVDRSKKKLKIIEVKFSPKLLKNLLEKVMSYDKKSV